MDLDFSSRKDIMYHKPLTVTVFGASGSLAKLKIFPSIYELYHKKRLNPKFCLLGYSRTRMSTEEFRETFKASVRKHIDYVDEKKLENLTSKVHYFGGQYDNPEDFRKFETFFNDKKPNGENIHVAYLSVPPSVFSNIAKNLGNTGLNNAKMLRVIVEKPFGYDLESAKKLKKVLYKSFKPVQIFLLDHYLGKESVINLISLRYANPMISALMDRNLISNIQVNALEKVDVDGRGSYFDDVGTIRDMIQSHIIQIISFFAMDLPTHETSEKIIKEKTKLIKALKLKDIDKNVVRGQFTGYKDLDGVSKKSQTETYAAIKMEIDRPKWKGIPIYMRTGKAINQQWTSVVVEFKVDCDRCEKQKNPPNRIVFQLQPYQKIEFHMLTKLGGETFDFHSLTTGQAIQCVGDCLSEHGRLFLEAVSNRKALFLDFEQIFSAWKIIDRIKHSTKDSNGKCCKLNSYSKNSFGPKQADKLIERDGFKWLNPEPQI